jgi:hypothetical protein
MDAVSLPLVDGLIAVGYDVVIIKSNITKAIQIHNSKKQKKCLPK